MRRIPLLAAAVFYLLCPAVLEAQTGAVTVRVLSNEEEPVAGASIDLLSRSTPILNVITDRSGRAILTAIPVGRYRLQVDALGYLRQVVPDVTVDSENVRVVEVILEPDPVELGEIVATADRVRIRREDTDFGSSVDEEAIRSLPVLHDARQLVALTPGARPDHVWGGANFQANAYRVDGLSATNPGMGGFILEPSVHWIERVEVKGLGAGAEHGGFQGGEVNVITKRGHNELAGSFFTTTENDILSATNLVETEIGSEVQSRYDVEGDIGGAFIRDRLFYYLGARYTTQDSRALNHLGGVEGRYSPFMEQRTEQKLFAKLTWEPRPGDEINASGGYLNTSVDNYHLTGFEYDGATSDYTAPTWFSTLTWRHFLGERGHIEARVNHFSLDARTSPREGPDRPGVRFFAVVPPYTTFGNAPFTLRSAPASTSASLIGTFRFGTGDRSSQIKLGGEYSSGRFRDRRSRNGSMTWMPPRSAAFDPDDATTWPQATAGFLPSQWGGEVDLDASVMNAALFAQSALSFGRLVLSPGLRWGIWQGWITPADGRRFSAVRDQAVDLRVGGTFELDDDGSTVLKAHWGRYHQDMITQMFDRAAGTDVFTNEEIWYYRGAPFSDPTTRFTEAERDALAASGTFTHESTVVLNQTGPVVDYNQPYIDQWLVGFEKEIGPWVKVEGLFTRRTNHDMIALVDRNRDANYFRFDRVRILDLQDDPVPYNGGTLVMEKLYVPNYAVADYLRYCSTNLDQCTIPSDLFRVSPDSLTWDPDLVLTNAPDARRAFNQVQLTVEVARPTWGGSFSLAFTKLEGNLDNVSGYEDPMDYGPGPYVRVNEGINSYGTLPNFSEREAKVSIWGELPFQIRGGLFWTYQTGDHFSPRFRLSTFGYHYNANTSATNPPQHGPGLPPSPYGEPLPLDFFTPLEGHYVFIGPRGLPHLEARSNFDVRFERTFRYAGHELGVTADLFNVFGREEVTEVNTMVNYGQHFYRFLGRPPALSGWDYHPENEYYKAPLSRVRPRVLRVGVSAYF